jgi:hypothetical protein
METASNSFACTFSEAAIVIGRRRCAHSSFRTTFRYRVVPAYPFSRSGQEARREIKDADSSLAARSGSTTVLGG